MAKTLNWGLLATGNIANMFARASKLTANANLFAVASRSQANADEFGKQHQIARCYGSYQQLLDDPGVDAVYISTPHPMHLEWALKAAKAKKHILCEKPIAMNAHETAAIIDAARDNGIALMEAYMYRVHPQTLKVIELLRSGAIGQVRLIQGTYGFNVGYNPDGRIYNKALGGGGILDVGCYPVSSSRLFAGIATGQDFAEPTDIHAVGHIGETGVDEWSTAVLRFPGNIIAQWTTAIRIPLENQLRIYGSGGWIHISRPYHPGYWGGGECKIQIHRGATTPLQEITFELDRPLFTIAIEAFTQAVLDGKQEISSPGMTWADSLGNMKAIDQWCKCINLTYDTDHPLNAS